MATVTIWTENDIFIIDNVDEAPYNSNGGWTIASSGGDSINWFEEGSVKRIEYDATYEGDEPEPDWSAVDAATQALESLALAAVEAERAVNSLNRTTGGAFGKDVW